MSTFMFMFYIAYNRQEMYNEPQISEFMMTLTVCDLVVTVLSLVGKHVFYGYILKRSMGYDTARDGFGLLARAREEMPKDVCIFTSFLAVCTATYQAYRNQTTAAEFDIVKLYVAHSET